jgi:hypothetical protein
VGAEGREKMSIVARIQEILKSQTLHVLGDLFIVIPPQNVLRIEVSPPPHKIPLNAIKAIKVLRGN